MSNSEPSAIVLQGIAGMRGIVQLSVRIEKTAGGRPIQARFWREVPRLARDFYRLAEGYVRCAARS